MTRSAVPQTTLLIGHRGVGKSSLLKRVQSYLPQSQIFDLDALVSESAGLSVAEIFLKYGEAHFRQLEEEQLFKLLSVPAASPCFVALGAGYEGRIPSGARCLWVRRETDARGRIFLDRPRLEASMDPLAEFLARYPVREARYARMADEVLTLREGCEEGDASEQAFFQGFSNKVEIFAADLTLLPENLKDPVGARQFLERRLDWGVRYFELREDLLSEAQVRLALEILPVDRVLYSVRADRWRQSTRDFHAPPEGILWDWDLDLGPCPDRSAPVCSLHARKQGESLSRFLGRLESGSAYGSWLKAAPQIESLEELWEGHLWRLQDPARRVFLPRSMDSSGPRWKWYRLLSKGSSPLNFIREGGGSAVDQPTLLEWKSCPHSPQSFAAVLGNPVAHSRTPTEQEAFFAKRGMPVFAVSLSENEWRQGGLETLQKLGLRYAAVTAPLKRCAYDSSQERTSEAQGYASANTLAWDAAQSFWKAHNTDFEGLRLAIENLKLSPPAHLVVWGGGGTLPVIEKLFPAASFYSAREGRPRHGAPLSQVDWVIWAAGAGAREPDPQWTPRVVIDLNYFEDSPGRAYALKTGARYVSGLAMFRGQAAEQRQFWSDLLEDSQSCPPIHSETVFV